MSVINQYGKLLKGEEAKKYIAEAKKAEVKAKAKAKAEAEAKKAEVKKTTK